jgi:hypothetical protein
MANRSLEGLLEDETVPTVKAEIVPVAPAPLAEPIDTLRAIEDRVLTKALRVVEDGLAWADIDIGEKGIPDEWIRECGSLVEAKKRQRAAHAAQCGPKEAPVGLKLAKEVFVGVVKARATERAAPKQLNLIVGKMDFQLPSFPKVKVTT